ncbi:COP23 domain-containing protein [Merismopedia glauca]|uniref:Uncharacterized protein n=1 Tax=Merismopedia glauca CCAP 1448/3 TaxID=1296344 RepID=A0A2T1C2I0_9CYAN|nr:COP23 domain-containing protein [Merismopedia glauca]PSB02480.1 hypothetical protein C7B64_12820 [Merismopedia glauca CCAP 1448/3]
MNKLRSLTSIVTGLAIAFGSAAISPSASLAGNATFFCAVSRGTPATYARTARGNVKIISWASNVFGSTYSPLQRCVEVSRRFQRNYDNGNLRTIKTGFIRGYPVVCAARTQDSPCSDRTLLFTLNRGSNANLVARRLLDRNGLAAGAVIYESSCEEDCALSVSVDTFLENATTSEEDVSPVE